jgi:NAD(P)-dependent dehydrogenase (short-subunit alcohol dehydrogenase family)
VSDRTADFAGRPGAALVVGGTGGLGLAVVRMLARRGSHVALTYRSRKDAAEAAVASARQWGVRASAHELDLACPEAAAEVVAAVAEGYDGLHTVVHAAGAPVSLSRLAAVAPETMGAQLSSDAAGFFAVVQAALPHLRHVGGSVVAVTSAATTRHPDRGGLSTAPKAAVEALVRGLAAEEGRFGVRVNAVGPGLLTDGASGRLISSGSLSPTDLDAGRARIPLARLGTATDVAEAVCFLASDRAAYISGQKLDVDGGYGA